MSWCDQLVTWCDLPVTWCDLPVTWRVQPVTWCDQPETSYLLLTRKRHGASDGLVQVHRDRLRLSTATASSHKGKIRWNNNLNVMHFSYPVTLVCLQMMSHLTFYTAVWGSMVIIDYVLLTIFFKFQVSPTTMVTLYCRFPLFNPTEARVMWMWLALLNRIGNLPERRLP